MPGEGQVHRAHASTVLLQPHAACAAYHYVASYVAARPHLLLPVLVQRQWVVRQLQACEAAALLQPLHLLRLLHAVATQSQDLQLEQVCGGLRSVGGVQVPRRV